MNIIMNVLFSNAASSRHLRLLPYVIQCVPQKGFELARSADSDTIHTLSTYPSVHKQLIRSFRTLFEADIV